MENYGAAFGILQNRKLFFIIVTSIVIISIVFFLYKNPYNFNKIMQVALAMLLGGGSIGNLIDRIRLGYVIDFISTKIGGGYDFPVFNIADMFIVISTFLIVILVMLNRYEA